MNSARLSLWFTIVSFILIIWGVIFALFGLNVLPVINSDVLVHWVSSLYGAIMIGWGITLLGVGRIAFRKNDPELMKILLYGLFGWLVVEAFFSAVLGVWPNVGVDILVFLLFSIPLYNRIKQLNKKS